MLLFIVLQGPFFVSLCAEASNAEDLSTFDLNFEVLYELKLIDANFASFESLTSLKKREYHASWIKHWML